jgi:hypothetical protein
MLNITGARMILDEGGSRREVKYDRQATEVFMIRTYRRPANAEDVKAMTEGRGSLVRNILTVTLPIGAILLVGMYWVTRSYWLAIVVASMFLLGSIWSNTRFFKTVGEREQSGSNPPTVEVIEVEATRVLDIEHLGSHGPAYCFFVVDGRALLLIGQWLMRFPGFPSLSFRLFRWVADGRPIRIEATGKTIEPEHSTVGLQSHYSNGDIEVFRAQPSTLQHDLENAFGKGAA